MKTTDEQFRLLANVYLTIERETERMTAEGRQGLPVASIDLFCDALRVTKLGAEVLVSMIQQSDRIAFSECKKWVVVVPRTESASAAN